MEKAPKPIKAKPILYTYIYESLKEIAQANGYNLLIHGSLNRDLDLVCITWSDNPISHLELLALFGNYLGIPQPKDLSEYLHSILPGNRDSYVLNLLRGNKFTDYEDKEYYLDISFTPYK